MKQVQNEEEVAAKLKVIEALEIERQSFNDKIATVRDEIKDLACPFKVGDRVKEQGNSRLNFYEDGALFEVSYIKRKGSFPYYTLFGYKIRKNGEPSKRKLFLYGQFEKVPE